MFLQTIAPEAATGEVAEIYRKEIDANGFLMAATRCWTTRPEVLPLFEHFTEGVKANFSLGMRGWRLITLIAAKQVPSTYCSHVYARTLARDLGKAQVLAIQRDFRNAGLSTRDVAMLAYAEQVARDASKITQNHIDALREVGFSDVEISDIALCASIRSFVSRFFDATGAAPEPIFLDENDEFRTAMTVGKPI
ncbi:carboxymuconolactone decarboxylase family protein [Devosia sp. A449]